MADAVKSTAAQFSQPAYYDDPYAQQDMSNWAPEPYVPPQPQYIEQQDYSNWGAPPVTFEDGSVGIENPNWYAPSPPPPVNYADPYVQQDMSNWYNPPTLAGMVPPGYSSPNVIDMRAPEVLDLSADASWMTNNYMPPPIDQMDQSNWAPVEPLNLNPNYNYVPPVYQPAPVDQGDMSNWYAPPPDNAEYVQGY